MSVKEPNSRIAKSDCVNSAVPISTSVFLNVISSNEIALGYR